MSVLLTILFAAPGLFAVIATIATFRRYLPRFGELRRALRESGVETVRGSRRARAAPTRPETGSPPHARPSFAPGRGLDDHFFRQPTICDL